jgi:hypothetical protein
MDSKKWFESRTIWFNLATLLVLIASVLADPALVNDPMVLKWAAVAVAIGNVALRFVTSVAIEPTLK